jgi:hypothetical protein
MENTMTLAYETGLYNYGDVTADEPKGFAKSGEGLSYDKTASPLTPQGGGTASIFGPGGAVNAVSSAVGNLTDKNFVAGGLIGLKAFNTLKGVNLTQMATQELSQIGTGILRGDTNTLNRLSLPKANPGNGTNSSQQPIQE